MLSSGKPGSSVTRADSALRIGAVPSSVSGMAHIFRRLEDIFRHQNILGLIQDFVVVIAASEIHHQIQFGNDDDDLSTVSSGNYRFNCLVPV